jgi:hemoglobin-like flavoprotein
MDPQLLKANFAIVAEHGEDVTAYFYDDLFERAPSVRPLFADDMKAQQRMLLQALINIVEYMDAPDELVPFAQELGRKHAGYGALPDHFPAVGASLIATLAHFSGDTWNAELEQGWTEAYTLLAQVMTEALAGVA